MILSIDPGLKTGVVAGTLRVWQQWELDFPDIYTWLDEHIGDRKFDVVVIENFLISAQTGKKSQAPWSLKIIGAVEHMCIKYGVDLVLQTPSEAKNFITNDKMRKYGMWITGGEGHARDAMRHFLLYHFKTDPEGTLNELL